MKSIMLVLVLAFCASTGIAQDAQARQNREEIKKELDDYLVEIGVNDDQMKEIEAARETLSKGVAEARQNRNREKMKSLRDDYTAKLKEILTEEQYAAFSAKQKELRENSGPKQTKAKKPN